jgi:hypothetical protein
MDFAQMLIKSKDDTAAGLASAQSTAMDYIYALGQKTGDGHLGGRLCRRWHPAKRAALVRAFLNRSEAFIHADAMNRGGGIR